MDVTAPDMHLCERRRSGTVLGSAGTPCGSVKSRTATCFGAAPARHGSRSVQQAFQNACADYIVRLCADSILKSHRAMQDCEDCLLALACLGNGDN